MRFDIITIFPDIFESYFKESIVGRAIKQNLAEVNPINLRDYTADKHKTVDDAPYGGGAGMVMMVKPIYKAIKDVKKKGGRVILLSAKGKKFNQKIARRFAKLKQLVLICGRYEGVDERVAEYIADEEISIGDYVLTGGELPAMIVADAVVRLLSGVIAQESLKEESFSEEGKVEYPQYTRPEDFKGWKVPPVLLSGNHKEIEKWRRGRR